MEYNLCLNESNKNHGEKIFCNNTYLVSFANVCNHGNSRHILLPDHPPEIIHRGLVRSLQVMKSKSFQKNLISNMTMTKKQKKKHTYEIPEVHSTESKVKYEESN